MSSDSRPIGRAPRCRRAFLASGLVVLLAACAGGDTPAPDPSVPEVRLGAADAAPFVADEVEELHEDAEGRAWFALYQRPALVGVRFGEATTADTIGALGSAPGEFRMPFAVMDAPAGGIFALDGVARRLVGFTSTGAPGEVLAVPESVDQFTTRRDTRGAWVSALGERARNDSVPLVRVTDAGADTLARLHVPKATVTIPMGARSYVAAPEFAPRDLWGALADGTVWIARGGTHAVEYHLPGGVETLGGPRAFSPVRSTDADRGTMRGLPAPANVAASALQYADVKGPFLEARAAPDGSVWTWRTQPAPWSTERYTVFRPGVAETFDVVLPLHHRVVGVGRAHVYVAERLDDGRWRVTRHARPVDAE
jgi:hypothetical protein